MAENEAVEFLRRVKETAEKRGVTLKQVAEDIGIHGATMSHWKHAKTGPSLITIIAIAKRLNVSIDWLCGLKKGGR